MISSQDKKTHCQPHGIPSFYGRQRRLTTLKTSTDLRNTFSLSVANCIPQWGRTKKTEILSCCKQYKDFTFSGKRSSELGPAFFNPAIPLVLLIIGLVLKLLNCKKHFQFFHDTFSFIVGCFERQENWTMISQFDHPLLNIHQC